jgi:hypothetical protein
MNNNLLVKYNNKLKARRTGCYRLVSVASAALTAPQAETFYVHHGFVAFGGT